MQQHHQISLPPPHQSDHEIISLHNDNHNNNTSSNSSSSPQLPPLPQLQSQTSRVVQIPADQVFCRVLPPPNNNNVHSIFSPPSPSSSADHQNSADNNDNTSCLHRSKCFSSIRTCMFLTFIIFILLLIIIGCILYLSLNPKSPIFIIQSLSLKFSSLPKNNSADNNNIVACYYNLSIETNNPNSHIGFYYLQGGSASLSNNKREIAHGTPPEFYNGKKQIRVFELVLESSSESLSKVFAETIMKEHDDDDDKYSNGKVPLVVFIRLPVKIKVGKLKLWKMKMKITCDISISLSLSQINNLDLKPHYCKNTIH